MKRSPIVFGVVTCRQRVVRPAGVALVLLLLGMSGAWAACVRRSEVPVKYLDMSMGTVLIANDLAVGSVIKTGNFPIPAVGAKQWLWHCEGGGQLIGRVLQGTALPGSPKIFSTNVAGVGMRMSIIYAAGLSPDFYPVKSGVDLKGGSAGDIFFFAGAQFVVELIKTAAVTGNGPVTGGPYTQLYGDGDFVATLSTFLGANGTTILTPSCTVDLGSRNIPVDFGKVPLRDFKGKGSSAGERGFSIKLNCKAGQNAQNTVLLRMDATADPSNVQGVLRLTQAGTATAGGVGIQVIDGTRKAPVQFGTAAEVGPSKEGSYVLPYSARYYQTGDKVTPGQANGTATFTLEYK